MQVVKEDAQDIVWDCHPDWKVIHKNPDDTEHRWNINRSAVFKYIPTGKLYEVCWQVGVTENQECDIFYDEEPVFMEVESVEVIVTQYRAV